MESTIVAIITRNLSRVHLPTQVLIEVSSPDGRQTGLRVASAVSCNNLFTIALDRVYRVIGRLPNPLVAAVDRGLAAALALSGDR